jgi:uncharacterized protein HemX
MGKVIQGLAVAAALALGGLVWRIVLIHEAEETMQHAILAASQQQQMAFEQQRQRELATQATERQRHVLADDQRCVGGTVITVRGTVYTQDTGQDGRPIHCSGSLAAVPLR